LNFFFLKNSSKQIRQERGHRLKERKTERWEENPNQMFTKCHNVIKPQYHHLPKPRAHRTGVLLENYHNKSSDVALYFLTVKVAPPPFNVTANFMSRFSWECEARIKEKVAWDFSIFLSLADKYPTVVLRSIYHGF
jgi:hypothetical protein